jgi:hypothetical protein
MRVDISVIRKVAEMEFQIAMEGSDIAYERVFRSLFGLPSERTTLLWNRLVEKHLLPGNGKVKYLLWTLLHLKIYGPLRAMSQLCSCTERTYHLWVRKFTYAISMLNVIKWENRFTSNIGKGIRTGSLLRIEYGKNRILPSHREVWFGKNRDIPIFPPIS